MSSICVDIHNNHELYDFFDDITRKRTREFAVLITAEIKVSETTGNYEKLKRLVDLKSKIAGIELAITQFINLRHNPRAKDVVIHAIQNSDAELFDSEMRDLLIKNIREISRLCSH